MIFTGKFQGVTSEWNKEEYNITFSINEKSALEEIKNIQDCEKLSITAEPYRKKRSLDSNAYAWVLMQKIAEASGTDRNAVYLDMLQNYSREFDFVICKEHAVERFKKLYRTCIDLGEVNVNGTSGHQLQVFYGSSTFDSKAMSVFIDGIVSECKQLKIETLPPHELERMKASWNNGK